MKLRTIELTNIRRFAGQRAKMTGIGDGLTVLAEPNEFGKSTFFDALQALFFEKSGSRNGNVRGLQPHAGGAPEVAVDLDLPSGRFRISKRWLSRPQAQVHDATGRLIAQADEAEAWLDQLLGGGLSGPSGLLWVRQGQVALEAAGRNDPGLAVRRDLLSSVAGEIDQMTGGRRMDAVLAHVTEALARLATATGRPKAGGEWARALEDAAALGAQEAELRPRAQRLSGDLARRADVQRSLARLTEPTDAAARAQALADADAAHKAALAHQTQVKQAETVLHMAQQDLQRLQQDIGMAEAMAMRLDQARRAVFEAQDRAQAARARALDLGARDAQATRDLDTATQMTGNLRTRLQTATRAQAARQAQAQATELQRRLDRAIALQTSLDQARAKRGRIAANAKLVDAADAAQAALDLAKARAAAQSVTIDLRPDGPPALLDGTPLQPGPIPIPHAVDLSLPGFGTMRIDPGSARGSDAADAVASAAQTLSRLLADAQSETVASLRAAWAQAQKLDADARQTTALLAEVAPDGLDALRAALARAQIDAADALPQPEDSADLAEALRLAEADEMAARAAAKAAHGLAIQAGEDRAGADASLTSAERHLAELLSQTGDPAELAARVAALTADLPALSAIAAQGKATLDALCADAPDLATADARLARARSAIDQARISEHTAREELASLNATIAALADEGIEERLAALCDARTEAEARAARYDAEFRALTRLRQALDDARARARDAYFGPVLRELQPLLAILYPGAELGIDDQSLLPATLTRNGQAEALDVLSGGTREQVAILTRLAFARLFAASGRPVPIILDDALVHSDDDRIEAMFDALHRIARDQQILVLSCRQRAFAALGGARAEVQIESL